MDCIREAMQMFDRADFVPANARLDAHEDRPLPIGYGQTISQPSTVQQMLEWLAPKPGDRVLDIGSGSGWTTAILSHLVGKKGCVYAVEIVPELVELGRENCAKYDLTNVEFFQATDEFGLPDHAPYDRILVSASANELPPSLVDQLALTGKMVVPVGSNILELTKTTNGKDITMHPGFVFVPLIDGKKG